jgi:hypothetical protein
LSLSSPNAPRKRDLLGTVLLSVLAGHLSWGIEPVMAQAERRNLAYVFRLRTTKNVSRALQRAMAQSDWSDAGQGWQGKETSLRLEYETPASACYSHPCARERQVCLIRGYASHARVTASRLCTKIQLYQRLTGGDHSLLEGVLYRQIAHRCALWLADGHFG